MTPELQKAIEFATTKHAGQLYGKEDYIFHLKSVHQVISRFGYEFLPSDFDVLCICAYLHDTLEDTQTTREELTEHFGELVSEIVWRVSDEKGKTRKERKQKTYPKTAEHNLSIALKLADRIANVESCREKDKALLGMYRKEHKDFQHHLDNGKFGSMWAILDELLK